MTSHPGRLYALAAALVAFFLVWAVVAARPWQTAAAPDPRLAALTAREQQLRVEARLVQRVVERRFADYRRHLAAYRAAVAGRRARLAGLRAAAPPAAGVRVVDLPPLVITRTS